ncbi:MAG: hypothetical protein HWD92_07835 [Flavobacteriia bacterium]|nr:hypothetical protein [Flavobacteriia bacterium]
MRKFALATLALITLVLTSCEDDPIVPGGQNTDNRNVEAWIYAYWQGAWYKPDTTYFLADAEIEIENIRMVFSDYNFSLSTGDTVDVDTSTTVASFKKREHKIGLLPSGTFTGEHQITVGFDSAGYNMPYSQASESLLADGIYRGTGGYNHLVITGKYRLLDDTVNLAPHLEFEYRLGGPEFNLQFEKSMSFSVTANNSVNIFFNFHVDRLFQGGLSPAVIEEIISDPNNNTDYLAATLLHMNFDQALEVN